MHEYNVFKLNRSHVFVLFPDRCNGSRPWLAFRHNRWKMCIKSTVESTSQSKSIFLQQKWSLIKHYFDLITQWLNYLTRERKVVVTRPNFEHASVLNLLALWVKPPHTPPLAPVPSFFIIGLPCELAYPEFRGFYKGHNHVFFKHFNTWRHFCFSNFRVIESKSKDNILVGSWRNFKLLKCL